MIKSLNTGKPALAIKCEHCGTGYESFYNRGHLKKYLKEFGQYENHTSEPCPSCGTVAVINLNLPADELSEGFFDAVDMPEKERQERRTIRSFMAELVFEKEGGN